MVDLMLAFPPLTEARHFPYLSLPYLTGHLRRLGRTVHQVDLNLALCHSLLDRAAVEAVRQRHRAGETLPSWYREAMADVVAENLPEVRHWVLEKRATGPLGPGRVVDLANRQIALAVEGSFLARTWPSWHELDGGIRAATAAPAVGDLPLDLLGGGLRAAFDAARPRVLGISVAFFSQLAPALLLAAWTRRLAPDVVVCLGGQQIMLHHDQLVRLECVRDTVDLVCTTAGEEPLARLLDGIDRRQHIADVAGMTPLGGRVRPGGRTSTMPTLRFRDLGPPDFGGLPVDSYLAPRRQLGVVSCVGCYWGRCAFCSYGNRSRAPGAYQQGTAVQIAEAVTALVRAHRPELLVVADENTNLRLILRAMREVCRRGLRVPFTARCRFESALLDPAFCQSLAATGCALLHVGYETNAQRLLDLLDKGVSAADYQEIIDNLVGAGIDVRLSVLGGLPNETTDEAARSRAFLADNAGKVEIDVLQLMVVEPGTLLARDPQRYGLRLDRSGRLAGNHELNYLGGRMGIPSTADGGPDRAACIDRMASVFRATTTSKGRAATTGSRGPVDCVRLRPWARVAPACLAGVGAGEVVVADLATERVYALPGAGVVRRHAAPGHDMLAASTRAGARLLARLVAADAATAS